ncbi:hypothetical protein FDUTEX481_07380, partial [Tolypothrix sp. PCC 7601]
LLLPSPAGRGVGGEGENLATKRVSREVNTTGQCLAPTICRILFSNWYDKSMANELNPSVLRLGPDPRLLQKVGDLIWRGSNASHISAKSTENDRYFFSSQSLMF